MAPVYPVDPHPDLSWSGWGDPALVPELPHAVRQLLADALGVRDGSRPSSSISEMRPSPSRLGDDALAALRRIAGGERVLTEDEARVRHLRGKSTPDLLRLRAGDLDGAPDAVILPGTHQEALSVLEVCSERRIAVLPYGGGTSVVGGLEPGASGFAGLIALDTRRMNALPLARRGVAAGGAGARVAGSAGRVAARRAGIHARALPAVVRVRHARWVRGGPLERPGIGGLRALRRAGAGANASPPRPGRCRSDERRAPRPARTCAS